MPMTDLDTFWIYADFAKVRYEITSDNGGALSSKPGNIIMPSFTGIDTITTVKTLLDITYYYCLRIHLLMSPLVCYGT